MAAPWSAPAVAQEGALLRAVSLAVGDFQQLFERLARWSNGSIG
jgi:hypothetical protein